METPMLKNMRPALVMLMLMVVTTGLIYPLLITGLAQAVMSHPANGSLVVKDGVVIGSELIGQNFADDRYFQPRPSATSAVDPADSTKTVDAPYNAANSSGSNLGPTSQKLIDRVKADTDKLKAEDGVKTVPADAVTTSGSGLDPHVSPVNAALQVARVAKARGVPETAVRGLVERQTEGRLFGILGEPRVNVLKLNLALDALKP
jgi:K+-transporting ATPase ATPase C chain